MRRSVISGCLFSALIGLTPLCLAAVIQIPADQPTIQAGIDAAVDGDTVLVAPGTYLENLVCGKQIVIRGTGSPSQTVVSPWEDAVGVCWVRI